MEEIPHWSEQSETSQSEADKEVGLSPPSPASPGSANSPTPLSIASVTGEWPEDGKEAKEQVVQVKDLDMEEAERSDEEYDPTMLKGVGRGQGRKRGRKPKSFSGEQGAPGSSAEVAPKPQGYRGRGRGKGRGRGRGRGRGSVKANDLSEDSDTSMKDFGDTSADWSPSQDDDVVVKKPRLSEGRRGRGRGRGRAKLKMEASDGEEVGNDEEQAEAEFGEEEMDELPLSCTECNKLFKDVSSLHRHEKIHSGLKPFVCIFCSKSFRQATQLKTHLRIHTGESQNSR